MYTRPREQHIKRNGGERKHGAFQEQISMDKMEGERREGRGVEHNVKQR